MLNSGKVTAIKGSVKEFTETSVVLQAGLEIDKKSMTADAWPKKNPDARRTDFQKSRRPDALIFKNSDAPIYIISNL